ncbi:hypothetical protein COCOBI_09-5280 [Coccomyxa sp. Obi]|nr:hypothetical protein COCOBI_09-5280 [Coccomyxa sp. Obi]
MVPETIRLYPKDSAAAGGMQWVAKRWQGTRKLYLHGPPTNGLACALAAMHQTAPAALTYLDLAWGRGEDAVTLSVLLTWLAGHAERLQMLSIQAYTVHCLPPMLHLKHLVVSVSGSFSAGIIQSVQLLRTLETLDLTGVGCTVPAIDLRPLRRLRKLALFGMAPSTLHLPPSCQLHVEVYCEDTARHKVWPAVLSQLWSFNWHQEDFMVNAVEALPGFLFSEKCPAHVRLCLGHICDPDAPLVLMGGIAHAKSLCITGDDVNVVMPSQLSWGHIHISARGALNLTFEDGAVEALGRAKPISLYQWWTAQGVGLIELYNAFQASRQKWWYDVDGAIASMWNSEREYEGLELSELCGCGACTPCLRGEEHRHHMRLLTKHRKG